LIKKVGLPIAQMYPTENVPISISSMLEFTNLYNEEGLFEHQEFVRRFMSPHTPYRSILLYHSPGSGKSLICISISIDHYFFSSTRTLIITKGQSGSNSFRKQIVQYMDRNDIETSPSSIFETDHYISLHNKIVKYSDEDIVDRYDDKIIVFDEIHNVREFGAREKVESVYKSLLRILRVCKGSRFIFSSATPMVDNHQELDSILNLINMDGTEKGYISFNSLIQERPQVRYVGTLNDHIIPRIERVNMRGHQKMKYTLEESTAKVVDIYKKLTHLALFSFPGNRIIIESKTKAKVVPIDGKKHAREITFSSYSVPEHLSKFLLGRGLRNSSCKYHRLMENISRSKGSVFVSVEEVHGSGLILLACILEEHGYELYYGQPITTMEMRYTICVGSSDISPNLQERLDAFNSPENKDGSMIRILLGSRVIGESITLLNVRQFHSMSPHWNYSKLNQAIGRVIRTKSHAILEEGERNVEVYVYIANETVDIQKLETCRSKQILIEEKESLLKDMSIERYCRRSRNCKNVDNFILYYTDSYMGMFKKTITQMYEEWETYTLDNIVREVEYPRRVVEDVLMKIVTTNFQVRKGFVLREDYGNFFLYSNPSSPFHIIRPPSLEDTTTDCGYMGRTDSMSVYENIDVDYIRTTDIEEKVLLLEGSLSGKIGNPQKRMIMRMFRYLYGEVGGSVYHVMLYRRSSSSYNAVVPFSKSPRGKTRILENGTWKFVENKTEEIKVLSYISGKYKERIRSLEEMFGIISVVDNRMRIRRGREEDDRRRTLKGRDLISMRKDELISICNTLSIGVDYEDKSSTIAKKIELYFLDKDKYLVV
jgi:hypothetical protein